MKLKEVIMKLKKLRSPHWYQIIALSILVGYNGFFNTVYLPQVLVSVATAGIIDFLIRYKKYDIKTLPKSAIITGLLIGTILGRAEIYVFIITAAIAIVSKYFIKWNGNILNPAAFAVLISMYIFSVQAIWWASGPLFLVLLAGIISLGKLKRDKIFFSFILFYGFLIILQNIFIQSFSLFIIPYAFLSAPFFLALFVLTDPKTSPTSGRGQIYFGALAALFSFGFLSLGIDGAFLLAILAINLIFNISKNSYKWMK